MGYTRTEAEPPRPSGRLGLRISPGAARNEVVGRHGERWKVRVAAPAQRGRANEAALSVVAEALGVRRADVRLVAGALSRDKMLEVSGITTAEAERRLAARQRKGDG